MPAVGVRAPMKMRAEGCVEGRFAEQDGCRGDCRETCKELFFPQRNGMDDNDDLPSESRNHAARYLNVFRSFLISCHRSMSPSRFHAATISLLVLHATSGVASSDHAMSSS